MEVFRKYTDFPKYEVDYTPTISFPDLEIYPDQRKVYCGKQEISLTAKQFNLLYYLVANEGRVLTYEQIYQNVWGNYVQDIENNTIGSHVCKLREKLYKACPDRQFEIRCVREVGYCFEAK
ncbi:response regulator transcription factor [uncultured Subdoligranulum sp.]|nr:response regulator transcription factor [uncultured Subdoligranulum sp.]